MIDWKRIYEERQESAELAVRRIHSGDFVVTSQAAGRPSEILDALVEHCDDYEDVRIFHIISLAPARYCDADMSKHFRFESIFACGPTRASLNASYGGMWPTHFSQVPGVLRDMHRPDVAVVELSPPNEHGYCSMGVNCDYMPAAIETAKTVIGLVNDRMIRTYGETSVHVSRLDSIVLTSRELPIVPTATISPVEQRIGEICADLIHDGDTLQIGIGAIPDAIVKRLEHKRDLGLHSELLSDSVLDLLESGAINNSRKTIDKYKSVTTFIMGTQRLYDFANNNPAFELRPVDYTNDPAVMARLDNLVSINSCIQVDFTGQVASESIGTYQYSGVGGQFDFVRGTELSKGGRSIIAMPSTAAKGTKTRIVPTLDEGTIVSTHRADVHYIATEYGAVNLRGKTTRERARALISISHPDFRDELKAEYMKLFKERY